MPVDLSLLEERALPGGGVGYVRTDNGRRVCGSRLRAKPENIRCAMVAIGPNGRCRRHGKDSGRPPVHGRYSKSIGRLQQRFAEHLHRKDILDVSPDLALMDVAAEELLERALSDGDGPAFRQEALRLYRAMRRATKEKDADKAGALLTQLGRWLEAGVDRARALSEAVVLADRRAQRAQREREIETKVERHVTEAQLTASFFFILEIVARHVDAPTVKRITDEVSGAMLPGSGPEAREVEVR